MAEDKTPPNHAADLRAVKTLIELAMPTLNRLIAEQEQAPRRKRRPRPAYLRRVQ